MHTTHHGIELVPGLVNFSPKLPNLWGLPFTCMKTLPSSFMLHRGKADNLIDDRTAIIESTSGNLGMGLALECNRLSLPLYLIGDPAMTPSWCDRLRRLGAHVLLIKKPDANGSYQNLRLQLLEDVRHKYPNHFIPRQYHNANNALAYAPVAEAIFETIGEVDALVGTVGSGGSVCGTGSFLRDLFPGVQMIGVDTPNSILFGQKDGPRDIRGMGNSVMPQCLKHDLFDEVHWVKGPAAFRAMHKLYADHRLFQGPTSGAAFLAARWYAQQNPAAKVIVILPDDGNRYADTVHNRRFLMRRNRWLPELPETPVSVDSPLQGTGMWTHFDWKRRTLQDVMDAARVGGSYAN